MSLSPREREIVRLIADGHSKKTAAAAVGCKYSTVHTHIYRVMRRLGALSTAHMVAIAIRQGLLDA